MGTTTFSGPIRAGTIKDTTGTTVGTNVANVGQVVMAQTFSTGVALDGGALLPQTQLLLLFQQTPRSLISSLTLLALW